MFIREKVKLIVAGFSFDKRDKSISQKVLRQLLTREKDVSLRSSLSRLVKNGELEKIITPQGIEYRLTELGWRLLEKEYSFFNQFHKKENKLYFLFFSFPERRRSYRDKLRSILKTENWLMLASSVYFSDHQPSRYILETLRDKRWQKNLILLEGNLIEGSLINLIQLRPEFSQTYASILTFISQADGVIGLIDKNNTPIHWQNLAIKALGEFFKVFKQPLLHSSVLWSKENLPLTAWRRFSRLVKAFDETRLKTPEF